MQHCISDCSFLTNAESIVRDFKDQLVRANGFGCTFQWRRYEIFGESKPGVQAMYCKIKLTVILL